MDDGSIQLCSRNIAVIYYLTKDWTAADGGLLIDLEAPGGPQTHVPKFNRYVRPTGLEYWPVWDSHAGCPRNGWLVMDNCSIQSVHLHMLAYLGKCAWSSKHVIEMFACLTVCVVFVAIHAVLFPSSYPAGMR